MKHFVQHGAFVPEGRMNIARRYNAGTRTTNTLRPVWDAWGVQKRIVPCGTKCFFYPFPALKRRAILEYRFRDKNGACITHVFPGHRN